MKKKCSLSGALLRTTLAFSLALAFSGLSSLGIQAEEQPVNLAGKIYEFKENSQYEFQSEKAVPASDSQASYGTFSINGNIASTDKRDGIPAYEVSDGDLTFFYNYNDELLKADADSWRLCDDNTHKVSNIMLDSDVKKGAIILQTSNDRKNWVTVQQETNAFSDTPVRSDAIYTTSNIELLNGCYYRVIVAYQLGQRTEASSFLFVNRDKYDYKKFCEVYEFYAFTDTKEGASSDQTYSLGSKVRVADHDSYFGSKTIDKKDDHYGWDLGKFFVSGYTDQVKNAGGDVVFLKNVGDKVTLWFKLNENIDALRGNDKLTVTADTDGYDQYFETPRMNMGRGTLIIRYTDHNNVTHEPVIYNNYLEANATVNADTMVQLFEEGDYEVALDYELTHDKLLDTGGHYRIFFKFAVRNGNCMVYPFDVDSESELTNSSLTENGFRLDLAKSRYLKVNLKREILKDSADGLIEDTRFNGPARDGAEYTDEGIYTITVQNQYTNQVTVKKIYVGTNDVLKAYMTTGLSIPEINTLLGEGAEVTEDGTIQLADQTTIEAEEPDEEPAEEDIISLSDSEKEEEIAAPAKEKNKSASTFNWGLATCMLVVAFLAAIGYVWYKKRISAPRVRPAKRQTIQSGQVRQDHLLPPVDAHDHENNGGTQA